MKDNNIKCTLCCCDDIEVIDSLIRNDDMNIYKMFRCNSCETHFLYPIPDEEKLEAYYDGKFREEVHTKNYYEKERMDYTFKKYSIEANIRVDRIKSELKKTDKILEVGCSIGYFMNAVAPYVDEVYGTEWDNKALAYINNEMPDFKVANRPENFGKKFDKIFLFHVLEHVSNPIDILIELKNLLNPEGTIYVELPNVDDILVKTYKCKSFMNYYYKKAHLFNFNYRGIEFIMEKTELKCNIDYIQRYDLSNHLVWLGEGLPKGKGRYADVLGIAVNDEYVRALQKSRQTDTLFIRITKQR